MEFFLPLPVLWSKNFFNKNFLISTQEFKIDFQNRKRNYLNRKRNYLSHFRASDQKTSFKRCFTFFPRSLRLIFKTGNGIISPTFRPMIKKLLLQEFSHFHQGVQNWFSKQETELSRQNGIIYPTSRPSDQKTSYTRCFTFLPRSLRLFFKTENEII